MFYSLGQAQPKHNPGFKIIIQMENHQQKTSEGAKRYNENNTSCHMWLTTSQKQQLYIMQQDKALITWWLRACLQSHYVWVRNPDIPFKLCAGCITFLSLLLHLQNGNYQYLPLRALVKIYGSAQQLRAQALTSEFQLCHLLAL